MSPLIEISGLRFAYGDGREALRGVDLAVAEGEHIVLVGPNGSGKSTLARIVSALEEPGTAERLLVCGRDLGDPTQRRAARRQAGILFQDPESQVVGATVEEDVAFGLENLGLPAAEIAARVAEMLSRFALEPLRKREPHLLSGGQKQRTALAGVLAVPRRLIILDEPTAMLDSRGRREVLDAMRLLGGQGLTVIAVTQEMDEVPLASRAVALEEGRVVFDGPPAHLFADSALVRRLSLGVPVAAEVAVQLRARGVALTDLPLTAEALAVQVAAAGLPATGEDGASGSLPATGEDGASGSLPATGQDAVIGSLSATGHDGSAGSSSASVKRGDAGSPPVARHAAAFVANGDSRRGLALRCEGMSFSYDDGASQVPAVVDVGFSLPAGSSTALLGPSGAGKTTLLLLLRGLLTADAGTLSLDGMDSRSPDFRALQRRVGVVFQRPEVQLFASTVADDVAFGPRQMGWPEDEIGAAVAESLEAVGLPPGEYGDRHPYSLSGGEQRRAALAGVLAMRPGVLLLDEPFVSLDPGGRRDLAAALRGLKTEGVTLVLATHDVDQAWALCDERLLLREGRLLADGPWTFDERGREALAAAGLPLPTLVELWRLLGLPLGDAPGTAAQAAAALTGHTAPQGGQAELGASPVRQGGAR